MFTGIINILFEFENKNKIKCKNVKNGMRENRREVEPGVFNFHSQHAEGGNAQTVSSIILFAMFGSARLKTKWNAKETGTING